uniref:Ig-like domain-containing protein n=1 Tax=Myripristis murdjan TaxID=586833 RepID=A0A668AEH6_9TELE
MKNKTKTAIRVTSHAGDSKWLLRGNREVGGRVTFFCPSHKDKMLTLFYLQKGTTFVNGYHNVRDAELYRAIPHSHVNHTERTVDMWALKVSDSGEYSCHVQYSDSMKLDETRIHLSVTANYSTPTLSVLCDSDSSSCQVTCASYGGYPSSEVMWNSSTNANSQWWTPGNSSEEADPDSMLINSSSTVIVNCSGPLQTLNCSVGGFTSDNLTVCKQYYFYLCISSGFGSFKSIGIISLVLFKMKKKKKKKKLTLKLSHLSCI